MKNKTLLSPIKRVSFFVAMTLNIQGCALLRVDGTNFDDIDGPNAGNPYDRNAQTAKIDFFRQFLTKISFSAWTRVRLWRRGEVPEM
jgi:hypothetical protein